VDGFASGVLIEAWRIREVASASPMGARRAPGHRVECISPLAGVAL